jgi:hypothetical protein
LAPATLSFSEKEALRLPACEVLGGWLAIALHLPLWVICPRTTLRHHWRRYENNDGVAQGQGLTKIRAVHLSGPMPAVLTPRQRVAPQHL